MLIFFINQIYFNHIYIFYFSNFRFFLKKFVSRGGAPAAPATGGRRPAAPGAGGRSLPRPVPGAGRLPPPVRAVGALFKGHSC